MPTILLRIVLIVLECGFAGIVNVAMSKKHAITVKEVITSIVISIFCGWIIYHFSLDWDISENTRIGVVCSAALCGREVLALGQKFVQRFLCKRFNIDCEDDDIENKSLDNNGDIT